METGLLLQYVVIALAVVVSAYVVIKKQFPGVTRRLRGVLALPLLRQGRAGWVQAVGHWVAPPAKGGGGGCGGCDSCGPTPPRK